MKLINTVFLVLLIRIATSTCPATSVNNSSPEQCTFQYSDSSGSCLFSACKLSTGVSSSDWTACMQSCCNQMPVPSHQDPSAVQECISSLNQTKSSSGMDEGVKEILIIVAINISIIILMILFIKLFGRACCCNPQSCCYHQKILNLCPRNARYRTEHLNAVLGPMNSRENIATMSEISKKKTISTISIQPEILQNWQTDEKAIEGHTCSICLDDSSNMMLECEHWFHRECIGRWTKLKRECPNCKRKGLKNAKVYCKTCRLNWQIKENGLRPSIIPICRPCSLSQF